MDIAEQEMIQDLIEIIDSHYHGHLTREKMEEIASELFKNLVYYKLYIQQ